MSKPDQQKRNQGIKPKPEDQQKRNQRIKPKPEDHLL
jgi:hypothetical protein